MLNQENSSRIAKNTLFLYFRMIILMLVTLYTSRIVLLALGVEDFGIYSVVGGIVLLFSFFNSAMASASQRFLSFEIGRDDNIKLKKVFSASLTIHLVIALLLLILAETIGLWILNNHLEIPDNRIDAANWVYQFSVATFVLKIIQVPFHATVIAHERMSFYAYISVAEAVLTLLLVFLLLEIEYDKLKLYALFIFSLALLVFFIFVIFCKSKFKSSSFELVKDKKLYNEMISYSGWSLFGNLAFVVKGQGVNILLNMFFGPAINAARAIAFQVQAAVQTFVSNFQVAVNPQIIKSYAANEQNEMMSLVFKSSKFSFYLLLFLTLPILLEADYILLLWLKIVPEYTALFTILIIINSLIDCLSGPLMISAQATGKIKVYQLIVGGILLLNFPMAYALLYMGYPPESTFYVSIFLSLIALYLRLLILKKLVSLPVSDFLRNVLGQVTLIAILSAVLPVFVYFQFSPGFLRFSVVLLASSASVMLIVYFLGLNLSERLFLKNQFQKVLFKFKKIKQ
jgi:O-antigen/teichoic acid export membrane protein